MTLYRATLELVLQHPDEAVELRAARQAYALTGKFTDMQRLEAARSAWRKVAR